jgi:plasmid maintenance system antidote protein VapI
MLQTGALSLASQLQCRLQNQKAPDPRQGAKRHRSEIKTVPLNRDIYPNLKLRMYTTGIRQNRLARMLGIHEASLSRIMNGFREPTGDVRTHLAEILHSDPDWLFYKVQISDDLSFAEEPAAQMTAHL